jgi:zinc protease
VIRQTEVDGVPTLLAPTGGPLYAGLSFRVGQADESLARRGITHLLEHLVLHRHGLPDYHYNGATGTVVTHFHSQGSPEDIVAFFAGVCAALTDLPLGRVETEKSILRTEEAGTGMSAAAPLPMWRYGAQGYGLVSYREIGLPAVTADDLVEWARRWFTRQNVVLWISADEVPSGLRLQLPEGIRQPVPAPSSALPETPAYFVGADSTMAIESVVRHRTAAWLYAKVLERQMHRSLRRQVGYSYATNAAYDRRGDDFATLLAVADTLPEKRDAALGRFLDVLVTHRLGGIDRSDLDSVRNLAEQALRHRDSDAAHLIAAAFAALTGTQYPTVDELRAEVGAATPDDLNEVAAEAAANALLMTPQGTSAEWAGYASAPTHSTRAVDGDRRRSLRDPADWLVVGSAGVSVGTADRVAATVPYESCLTLMTWPDGARRLIGADAISVQVEPNLFGLEPATIQRIDAAVPARSTIPMPVRDPEQIPRPPAHGSGTATVPAGVITASKVVPLIAVTFLATIALCVAGIATLSLLGSDPDDPSADVSGDVVFLVIGLAAATTCAVGAVRTWTRRGRTSSGPRPTG